MRGNTSENAAELSITDGKADSASTISEVWETILQTLKREVNPHAFAAYLEPLSISESSSIPSGIVLSSTSSLICNHVRSSFLERIRQLFEMSAGSPISVQVEVLKEEVTEKYEDDKRRPATPFVVRRVKISGPVANDSSPKLADSFADSSTINPRYTFSDFVVGNSNQFCHAAAMRVAENPGQSYNPLFIYGGVGLGKTHLLHAIGNAVLQKNSSAKVLYLSSETFTNELILALRSAKMEEFKRRMRAVEVLLIDDIQFISGKERTQEEFFHTFNALYGAKRQIVITSDKIPTEISGIEERLQTRFSWGLTADLQAPDFETRVAILKQKAITDKFDLPEEVSHLIAARISSNVRELEGALTRLHAVSSIQSIPISTEMAQSALKYLLQPKVISLTVDDIKKAVSTRFGIKTSEIISKRRTKNLSFPRHIAMYLCRKHTTCSYPEIGDHFGGRDHSSVIHAATVVASKISSDPGIKNIVSEIERSLLGA